MNKARAPQGVQSVEIALRVVGALADAAEPTTLRDLAKATGLSASKVHRYLVSLCRTGVAEQLPANGRYALGQTLIRLGLAALNQLDEYRLADVALDELVAKTGMSAALTTWGNRGPVLVRRKEPPVPVVLSTRVGSIIPTVSSATGRVFAAFLPAEAAMPLVNTEFGSGLQPTEMGRPLSRDAFGALLDQIRQTGLSRIQGDLLLGVDSLAAPVFDAQGQIVMALAIMGMHGTLDLSLDAVPAKTILRVAGDLSRRIGFQGHTTRQAAE